MVRYLRVFIWLLVFAVLFGITQVCADKVYLKDGTVETSERVWQSEKYVHFILKGTSDVTIRYAKVIVDRVLIDGVEEFVSAAPPAIKPATPEQTQPSALTTIKETTPPKGSTEVTPPFQSSINPGQVKKRPSPPKIIDQKMVRMHKGINFYDPRRDLRYWASNQSKHSTLSAALAAMAKMYGTSVKWVENYMGDENDLGAIHRNLMINQGALPEKPTEGTEVNQPSEGLFYTRGEAAPYRIGPNQVFKSQSAAVKALAQQYGRSVTWVQENFGQSNELKAIHENLNRAMQAPEKASAPGQEKANFIKDATGPSVKGNAFYNPRRQNKYWIGETDRFNSLDEALSALAKKYGVTVEWIERYMGNTNDLSQIHQNIQESLK